MSLQERITLDHQDHLGLLGLKDHQVITVFLRSFTYTVLEVFYYNMSIVISGSPGPRGYQGKYLSSISGIFF